MTTPRYFVFHLISRSSRPSIFLHRSWTDQVWSNAGARPGDVLILTKPLGTGTLTAALKRGEVTEDGIQDALNSMCSLNRITNALSPELSRAVHGATDITGFGLAGHALNFARSSEVSFVIESARLPRFERAIEFIGKGFLTKAHRTNSEYVKAHARFDCTDQPFGNWLSIRKRVAAFYSRSMPTSRTL